MSRNVYSAQIGLVTAAGNVNIIYPKTLAENVRYTNEDMTGISNVAGALNWLNTYTCKDTSNAGFSLYVDNNGNAHLTYDNGEEEGE